MVWPSALFCCRVGMNNCCVVHRPVDNAWVVPILYTGLCKTALTGVQSGRQRFSSRALLTTVTELNAMAAPANMGFK